MDPIINPEIALNKFLDDVIECDILDGTFSGFTKGGPELDRHTNEVLVNNLVAILQSVPPELLENVIKFYVRKTSDIVSYNISRLLFEILESAIRAISHPNTSDLTLPRNVCDYILSSPHFEFTNEVFWVNGLRCIRRILNMVSYKGVRDILGVLLAKIALLPVKATTASISKQINALYSLIEYIFDRNSALLPAYLILDEIQKKSAAIAWQNGHWKFSKLISAFVDSFRPVANIASIAGRPRLLPIVGYSLSMAYLKLEHSSAKYKLKGLLPYDKDLNEPQLALLLFIMEQINSREAIVTMLSLNKVKGRSIILENLLVELIIKAINKCGSMKLPPDCESFESYDLSSCETEMSQVTFLWQHVASASLYFEFIYQNIHFPGFLNDLTERVYQFQTTKQSSNRYLLRSREFFMWTLLQMLSGYISKQPVESLAPIFKLLDIFYPEKEPIPLPDLNKPNCIYIMAAASAWILLTTYVLTKKSENDMSRLHRPAPVALKLHINFLQEAIANPTLNTSNDFIIVLLCNTYSTNQESYARAFNTFMENKMLTLENNFQSRTAGSAMVLPGSNNNQAPIAINLIDSMAVQSRINLTDHIMKQFLKMAHGKSQQPLPAGMVETYSRMMAYTEIESFSIKPFLSNLIQNVLRNHCWNYLFTFLELFSYRLHRVNCAYRIQLLRQVFSRPIFTQINHVQLYSCIESTALKIIMGLNSAEFLTLSVLIQNRSAESLSFLPSDSEELNKIFILSLARAFHITGLETLSASWVNEVLSGIRGNLPTNVTWPEFTLKCFPSVISRFYQENARPRESNRDQLRQTVDEEYRRWKSLNNEGDLLKHFTTQATTPLFLCLLYKTLLDGEPVTLVVYKILDRIGVRGQSVLLRTFCDYLVYEFANLDGTRVIQFIDALNDLIWKYHVISFERLLLCLALRNFEGNESLCNVCFFIIQRLVIKDNSEFSRCVQDFVRANSPEHWKQTNWAEQQAIFLQNHPEEYYFKHLQDPSSTPGSGSSTTYLTPMFSNICLRVLPVFDVILHRLIEMPITPQRAEQLSVIIAEGLLSMHGSLYKFHDQPITYLYNTLHYYESNLRQKPTLKRKLVFTIYHALKDVRGRNWAFTERFLANETITNEEEWRLDARYYHDLISRVVDTLSDQSKCPLPPTDYRFNEFPNAHSHVLYVTCVEIMALPGEPAEIGNALVNVVLSAHQSLPREDIELWINAIALVLTSLPDNYSSVINERIIELLRNPEALSESNILYLADFKNSHLFLNESETSYLVAMCHAFWSHGSIGQVCTLSAFLKERIKPIIQTEEQFLLVCYLVGPFLHRFLIERTRCVMDITIELYEMLEIIDKKCSHLKHIDKICDLLYHIKYMFTGDHIKREIEGPIRNLRPEYSHKLRFITNIATTTDQS